METGIGEMVYCRERSERLYNKDNQISMVYLDTLNFFVNKYKWVGGRTKSFVAELLPDD